MNLTVCMSELFFEEEFFLGDVLDFRQLEGINCYCSEEAAEQLRLKLQPYGPEGVHWIDSGDYHYLSLFFLEKITQPFSLVLIDNHPDDQDDAFSAGMLSCGNWVERARESLPMMTDESDSVYVSLDLDALDENEFRTNWDQGRLSVKEVEQQLLAISRDKRIIGIDVCGGKTQNKGATPEEIALNRAARIRLSEFLNSI